MKTEKRLSMCARIGERGRLRQTKVSSRQGNLSLVVTGLLLVSVLLMMPTAEAPPDWDEWQYVYDVDNVLPENADPAWWRFQSEATRSIVHNNDLLRLAFGTGSTYEEYRYNLTGETEFLGETRFKIYNGTSSARFQVYREDAKNLGMTLSIQVGHQLQLYVSGDSKTVSYPNSDGVNYTLSIHVYRDISANQHCVEGYVNHDYFGSKCLNNIHDLTNVSWMVETGGLTYPWVELDYIVFTEGDTLPEQLLDLQREIDRLKRELERYKQDQGVPDVIKKGNLPFVPVGSRGFVLPQGYFELDPYLAYSYIASDNNTGNDFILNRVWNAAETDYMTLQDEWFITDSYTRLYVNDTKNTSAEGDDTCITGWCGTTETRSYHWTDYAWNLSVETDSAGSVKFNRVANIQVINTFSWGESSVTGAFITQSTIENDCSMDWRYINVYWAFPEEDSDGVYVEVDMSSIVVTDDDNNLELNRGEHWTTDAAGLYLAFQYLNASDDRTFTVEFNRRLAEEGDIVSIITDGDVEFTNTMRTYPFEFDVWYGIVSTRQFNGKWIIKFDFSREHANKQLGRTIVYVNGQFTSDFVIYNDRMEIYDLTFDAGSANQVRVLFDWKSGESEIFSWGGANLLALLCIGGAAIIIGARWMHRAWEKPGKKMDKFLGLMLVILGAFGLMVFGMLLF